MQIPKVTAPKSEEEHIAILLSGFNLSFGEPLLLNTKHVVNDLYNADFVVVSHDTQADPVFNYANQLALDLFELSFAQFTQLESRKSAGEISQTERNKLLAEVTAHGCIDNYTGIRISSTGKRFYIEKAKVWNLYDESGEYYGQAAMFKSWKYL
jgi:hypothetical protein